MINSVRQEILHLNYRSYAVEQIFDKNKE